MPGTERSWGTCAALAARVTAARDATVCAAKSAATLCLACAAWIVAAARATVLDAELGRRTRALGAAVDCASQCVPLATSCPAACDAFTIRDIASYPTTMRYTECAA